MACPAAFCDSLCEALKDGCVTQEQERKTMIMILIQQCY
jgi:hypothetical protein